MSNKKYILLQKSLIKIRKHYDHTFRCLNIDETLPDNDSNLNKHTNWFCKDQINICEWYNKGIPLKKLFELVQGHLVVVEYID